MTAARTVLGPLTTAFTVPSSCGVAVQACPTCDFGWRAQKCGTNTFNSQGVQDEPGCWPPRSDDSLSTGFALGGWGIYSPAVACPVGYQTACVATGTQPGGFAFQFPVNPSETAVGCCPVGFSCKRNPGIDDSQTCYSIASIGSFPTVSCSQQTSNNFKFVTVPATVTAGSTVVTLRSVSIFAPLFQLHMQASDMTRQTGGSTNAPGPTNSGDTKIGTAGASGLSPGAAAGIGIGATVIGIAIILGVVLLWRRRRRRAGVVELKQDVPFTAAPPYHANNASPHDYVPSHGYPSQAAKFGGEMDTPPPPQQAIYEAPSHNNRAHIELP